MCGGNDVGNLVQGKSSILWVGRTSPIKTRCQLAGVFGDDITRARNVTKYCGEFRSGRKDIRDDDCTSWPTTSRAEVGAARCAYPKLFFVIYILFLFLRSNRAVCLSSYAVYTHFRGLSYFWWAGRLFSDALGVQLCTA